MPVLANKSISRPGAIWNPNTKKWVTDLVPAGQCVRISPRRTKPWLRAAYVHKVYFDLPYYWCCGGLTVGVEGGNCIIYGILYTSGGRMTWTKRNGTLYTGTSITIPSTASFHSNPKSGFKVRSAALRFEIYPVEEEFKITGAFASGAGGFTTGEKRIDFTT